MSVISASIYSRFPLFCCQILNQTAFILISQGFYYSFLVGIELLFYLWNLFLITKITLYHFSCSLDPPCSLGYPLLSLFRRLLYSVSSTSPTVPTTPFDRWNHRWRWELSKELSPAPFLPRFLPQGRTIKGAVGESSCLTLFVRTNFYLFN